VGGVVKNLSRLKITIKDLVFTGIIITLLVFFSPASAQKRPEDVEATDFVLDVVALYLNTGEIDEAIDILSNLRASFPEDFDVRLYLGIALCRKNDYETAFKEFEKIEKTLDSSEKIRHPRSLSDRERVYVGRKVKFAFSPKNKGLLYFGRGVAFLISKGDYKAARKNFSAALKNGYVELNVKYLIIYSYLKSKNYKKASQELDNLLKSKEMDTVDYFLKGYIDYMREREEEAVFSLRKALEINPDYKEAKKNLAAIYYNRGEWEKAIETWKAVLNETPGDYESRLNMARSYYHLGRIDEARKHFEMLNISIPVENYSPKKISLVLIPYEKWATFSIKYRVDYKTLLTPRNIEKLKERGIGPSRLAAVYLNEKALFMLRTEGRIDEAIKILRMASTIDERGFFTHYNLGQLYFNSGDLNSAENCALQSIKHKKKFLEGHDLLGNIYFRKERYKDALQEFQRVVEISESDAQGHYNLGCAYWILKDIKNAEQEWKKAVEYDIPAEKSAKEEKFTQDGLDVSLIVQKKPVSYRAYISLGSLYELKDLAESAIQYYERAMKTEPYNPEAYFELGRVYFDVKNREKAMFYLKKHVDLGGRNQKMAKKLIEALKNK